MLATTWHITHAFDVASFIRWPLQYLQSLLWSRVCRDGPLQSGQTWASEHFWKTLAWTLVEQSCSPWYYFRHINLIAGNFDGQITRSFIDVLLFCQDFDEKRATTCTCSERRHSDTIWSPRNSGTTSNNSSINSLHEPDTYLRASTPFPLSHSNLPVLSSWTKIILHRLTSRLVNSRIHAVGTKATSVDAARH